MQEYVLNMTEAQKAQLKARWIANWGIDIEAEYGSWEQFAAQIKEDECWLEWQYQTGGTPAEYLAL